MPSKSNDCFWIVWNPVGERPPQQRHGTQERAQQAAKNLARQNPGFVFYVLRSTDEYVKVDVEHTPHVDLPF